MAKPVEHAAFTQPEKVLVSLENLTSLRGEDLLQNYYIVVAGYNYTPPKPKNQPRPKKFDKPRRPTDLPLDAWTIPLELPKTHPKSKHGADEFFFAYRTSLFQLQKGRPLTFPNGFPLFNSIPDHRASLYFACFQIQNKTLYAENPSQPESTTKMAQDHLNDEWFDREGTSQVLLDFQNLTEDIETAVASFRSFDEMRETSLLNPNHQAQRDKDREKIEYEYQTIKHTFSKLITAIETVAVNANHQIRFANVFTFRPDDEWLEGGHSDWGDHRISLGIKVSVS